MDITLLEKQRDQMFPKLTPAQLARLEAHCTRGETTAGEILLHVGERPHGLFIVTAGSIEVLAPTSHPAVRVQRGHGSRFESCPPHAIAAA